MPTPRKNQQQPRRNQKWIIVRASVGVSARQQLKTKLPFAIAWAALGEEKEVKVRCQI